MTAADLSPGAINSASDGLRWVAGYLRLPQSEGAVLRTIAAIRSLVQLLDREDRAAARPPEIEAVRAALAAIEPTVCAAAEPLTPEHVAAGLEHVRAMLVIFGRPLDEMLMPDAFCQIELHVLHAIVLADELSVALHRRAIAARMPAVTAVPAALHLATRH